MKNIFKYLLAFMLVLSMSNISVMAQQSEEALVESFSTDQEFSGYFTGDVRPSFETLQGDDFAVESVEVNGSEVMVKLTGTIKVSNDNSPNQFGHGGDIALLALKYNLPSEFANEDGLTKIGLTWTSPIQSATAFDDAPNKWRNPGNVGNFDSFILTSNIYSLRNEDSVKFAINWNGQRQYDGEGYIEYTIDISDLNFEYPFTNTTQEVGFTSLQDAIDNAADGDTILVNSGKYSEDVIIDKEITLKANELDEAAITGVIRILSDNVTIENLILEVESGGHVVELVNVNNILVTNNIIRNNGNGYGSLVTSTGPAHATGEISNNTFKGALVVGSNGELKIIDNKIETNTGSGEAIALYPATATSKFVVENNELILLEGKGGIKVQPLIVDTKPEGILINGLSDDLDIMLSLMTTNDILLKDVNLTWNNEVIYIVNFMFDDELLKRELVVSGEEATPPANPTREGYTFTGWDVAFDNVTNNLVVTAEYEINTYTVTFNDYDGTKIEDVTVDHGSDATPPANPTREGHTFNGWNATFTNVTSDLKIVATYLSKVVEAETKDFPKLEVEGLDDLDKLGITFTDEEKEKDVSVILVLELQKDEDVPKVDKDLLDAYLEANANIDSPMSLLLDISMLKIVGDSASAINELASPITISFEVPFAFRNIDFELLRVHDGKVESLDYDYNAETFILTFETDKFSTYALAEVAEESEEDETDPVDEENDDEETVVEDKDDEEEEEETLVPDMSDNGFRNIAYLSMLLGSLLVLLGSKRKLFAKITK